MDTRVRTTLKSVILLSAVGLAFPAQLISQDECEFEGTAGAGTAQEAFARITAESTEDEVIAANQEALDALSRELDDDNAIVLLFAAQASISLGQFDQANEHLTRYEEVADPECLQHGNTQRFNAWVQLYNSAVSAYSAGENEEALNAFLLANEFGAKSGMAAALGSFTNAALLQRQMGDDAGAMETYQAALAADIPDAEPDQIRSVITGYGELLTAEGRTEEAAEIYEDYMARHPEDVGIRIGYAALLVEQGAEEEAQNIYDTLIERDDLSYEQWLQAAVGLFNSGNYDTSLAAFGKARGLNPFNKEGMEGFANASILSGKPGPVIALADTLVKWYPYDTNSYQIYTNSLSRANMEDRAIEVAQTAQTNELVFHSSQMAVLGGGVYIVGGSLESRGATGTLTIPFEFLDIDGGIVQTETLSIEAPPTGQPQAFRLEIQAEVPIAGFRYKKSGT